MASESISITHAIEDHTYALPVGIHGQKCPQGEQELDPPCPLCLELQKRVSDLQQQFKQAKATIEGVKEKAFDIKTSKKFNILYKTNQTPRLLHPYKTFGILDIIVKGCSLTLQTEEFTELIASKDLRKKRTNKS